MKNLLAVLAASVLLIGCSTVQPIFNKAHEDVFGCPPVGQPKVERELKAEGPRDEVERDFMGEECGKPVYKSECGLAE